MGFDGEEGAGRSCERDRWREIQADAAAHRRTDALFAAVRLGLFDVVRDRPLTVAQSAGAMRTSVHRTKALLDLLVGYGYLVYNDEGYQQPPDLLPLTDPERKDNLQRRFAYPSHTRSSWSEIATALRDDRCVRDWGAISRTGVAARPGRWNERRRGGRTHERRTGTLVSGRVRAVAFGAKCAGRTA